MKIVGTSNFCTESVAEYLVASGITSEEYATAIVEALNDKFSGHDSPNYYKIVPDDYVIWRGMEEYVV